MRRMRVLSAMVMIGPLCGVAGAEGIWQWTHEASGSGTANVFDGGPPVTADGATSGPGDGRGFRRSLGRIESPAPAVGRTRLAAGVLSGYALSLSISRVGYTPGKRCPIPAGDAFATMILVSQSHFNATAARRRRGVTILCGIVGQGHAVGWVLPAATEEEGGWNPPYPCHATISGHTAGGVGKSKKSRLQLRFAVEFGVQAIVRPLSRRVENHIPCMPE